MKYTITLLSLLLSLLSFAQSPQLVKDINPGSRSIRIGESIAFNGKLIFNLDTSSHGYNQLWVSDGTATGTRMLKLFKPNTDVTGLIEMNGMLYFAADDNIHGCELWVTDGTSPGTHMVKDINPAAGVYGINTYVDMPLFTIMNKRLYFPANDGVHGLEMWSSDGTDTGTHMLKDINPSGNSISTSLYTINEMYPITVVNNQLFFRANDGVGQDGLWVSDGTDAGTHMIRTCASPLNSTLPATFMPFNNKLILRAQSDTTVGVWTSDGTTTGTYILNPIAMPEGGDYVSMGNDLFFEAIDITTPTYNLGLWKTDGTVAGTKYVLDSIPISGPGWSKNNNYKQLGLTTLKNNLYFLSGSALWISDGTTAGTKMLYKPDTVPNRTAQLIVANNKLYFRAFSHISGQANVQLFVSDGTDTGTRPIVYAGDNFNGQFQTNSLLYYSPTQVGNTLFYLNGYDNSVGVELYKLDIPTAVNTITKKNAEVSIYPNPAKHTLSLSINGEVTARATQQLHIINTLGQVVFSKSYIQNEKLQIDVHDLAAGVYFIQLDGVYAGKFVKE